MQRLKVSSLNLTKAFSFSQALDRTLIMAGQRLHSQFSTIMPQPPCVVGEYFPICSCKEGCVETNVLKTASLKCAKDSAFLETQGRDIHISACIHTNVNQFCCTVWAAVLAINLQDGGSLPRLSFVMVEGMQYPANTHVSVVSLSVG